MNTVACKTFRKQGFYQADAHGIITVVARQFPDDMHVVRQHDCRNGLERPAFVDKRISRLEYRKMPRRQIGATIFQCKREGKRTTRALCASITNHRHSLHQRINLNFRELLKSMSGSSPGCAPPTRGRRILQRHASKISLAKRYLNRLHRMFENPGRWSATQATMLKLRTKFLTLFHKTPRTKIVSVLKCPRKQG